MPTPQHFDSSSIPASRAGGRSMGGSVDIMGVQRGAHKDGDDICPKFQFKKPGGIQPDGTPLWGWNDADSARCARCKRRDLEHVVVRDFCQEGLEEERAKVKREQEKKAQREMMQHQMPAPGRGMGGGGDLTAANPTHESAAAAALKSRTPTDPFAAQMGVLELEPGVPDPLALTAYRQAEKEQSAALAAHKAKEEAERAAAAAAKLPATGGIDIGDAAGSAVAAASAEEENARFKAEVEKMVAEQLEKERQEKAAKKDMSLKEMLASINLEQYLPAFEEEGMEMSVLVELARTEDGKAAVDEALKELGVKSIGHRLKIFAALQ